SHHVVASNCRRYGIGTGLMDRLHELHATVGSCGLSVTSVPLFRKSGWPILEIPRWLLVRRTRSLLEKHLGAGRASRLASRLADPPLRLAPSLALATWAHGPRGLRVRPWRPGSESDALLGACRRPLAFHRSIAWLEWARGNAVDTDDPTRDRETELFLVEDE